MKKCSICFEKVVSKGLCVKHYNEKLNADRLEKNILCSLCDNPAHSFGMCKYHYQRQYDRKIAFRKAEKKKEEIEAAIKEKELIQEQSKKDFESKRFELLLEIIESLPETDTKCKIWSGKTDSKGYPNFFLNGRKVSVHRLLQSFYFPGKYEKKRIIRKCNNRLCCNFLHFKVMTGEQMWDKQNKEGKGPLSRKHLNPSSKLNAFQVLSIRESSLSPKELAKKYNVWPQAIHHIIQMKSWKHI